MILSYSLDVTQVPLHILFFILMFSYSTFIIYDFFTLKGQCHEIFDLCFFRQSITPGPQMNTLKYFRILFRIRWEMNENVLIPRYAA
jgi:hypothetical protein